MDSALVTFFHMTLPYSRVGQTANGKSVCSHCSQTALGRVGKPVDVGCVTTVLLLSILFDSATEQLKVRLGSADYEQACLLNK